MAETTPVHNIDDRGDPNIKIMGKDVEDIHAVLKMALIGWGTMTAVGALIWFLIGLSIDTGDGTGVDNYSNGLAMLVFFAIVGIVAVAMALNPLLGLVLFVGILVSQWQGWWSLYDFALATSFGSASVDNVFVDVCYWFYLTLGFVSGFGVYAMRKYVETKTRAMTDARIQVTASECEGAECDFTASKSAA